MIFKQNKITAFKVFIIILQFEACFLKFGYKCDTYKQFVNPDLFQQLEGGGGVTEQHLYQINIPEKGIFKKTRHLKYLNKLQKLITKILVMKQINGNVNKILTEINVN